MGTGRELWGGEINWSIFGKTATGFEKSATGSVGVIFDTRLRQLEVLFLAHIAILGSRGIPAQYGGFETFAEEVSMRLVERGISVTVYCENTDDDSEPIANYKGINLVHIAAPNLGHLSTILYDLRCLWHARRGYDFVYMLGYGTAFECLIPRLWGTPTWINMDGIEWLRSKWGRGAKLWLRVNEYLATKVASRLIADADGIREHIERRYRRLPPISVIQYGAPVVESFSTLPLEEWGLDSNEYYIVVARLDCPENHVLEIIEGFCQTTTQRQLVVVGGLGKNAPYIAGLLKAGDSRVRFVDGVYDQAKLQALRGNAYAHVHGHSVGGTNPSLLEAMGCGNLIFAHDNVYNREVASGGALYFNDAASLAELIGRAEDNPQELRSVAECARNRISTIYNWELITDKYEALINQAEN